MVEDPDAVETRVLSELGARDDLIPRELVLRHIQAESHAPTSLGSNRRSLPLVR